MSDDPEYDATVRHAVYIERHKASVARKIVAMVNGVTNDLYAQITASDLDQLTRRQLDALLRDIEAGIKRGYGPITEAVEVALKDFAVYEADWQAGVLGKAGLANFGVPSDAALWAAVNARPFEGKFLEGWLDGLSANTVTRVKDTVRQGYVDGVGPLEVARQIRGTRTRKGVMDISKRGAEMMVRTAMASTSAVARERGMQSLRRVQRVQWVSVLDHRTTAICQARDGTIYDKNKGPRPPAHVGCRSTIIPLTRSNEARVESRETYQDWLKRQPASVQDDILGPTRGKLYRDGGYTVDRFVDKSGQEYTLDELRAKDVAAWSEVFGE